MECIIHCSSARDLGTVKDFKETSWHSTCDMAKSWRDLKVVEGFESDSVQCEVAIANQELWEKTLQHMNDNGLGFHQQCYNFFVNRTMLARAQKKIEKREYEKVKEKQDQDAMPSPSKLPRRLLRSDTAEVSTTAPGSRRGRVLPEVCVMCGKRQRIYKRFGLTRRDPLKKAETEHAGVLRQVALGDPSEKGRRILHYIQDLDCVAIEAQYHKNEYEEYTKSFYKDNLHAALEPGRERASTVHERAFDMFCETIVDPELVTQRKVVKLSRLASDYNRILRTLGPSGTVYRSSRLKARIQKTYPRAVFTRAKQRNHSGYVFMETDDPADLPVAASESEETTDFSATDTDTATDTTEITGEPARTARVASSETDIASLQVLYTAALMIRQNLKRQPNHTIKWPPNCDTDFDISVAESIVPIPLYNVLAWSLGLSTEETLDKFAHVSSSNHLKLLSIIQDMIHLESKGRNFTPKCLSRGVTVKHWTGSSRLVRLLSRLGHCVSDDVVRNLETALAQSQIDHGISSKRLSKDHTILIYDNIDFKEETLSGHGQSHFTNGIAIQDEVEAHEIEEPGPQEPSSSPSLSKKQRKLVGGSESLEMYEKRKRHGPESFHDRKDEFPAEKKLEADRDDLLYEIMKCVNAKTAIDLPGWTGFNTLLHRDKKLVKNVITYLPIIDGNPTEMDTILTILKRSVELADSIEQEEITVVFDLAIYAKIQEIRWLSKEYAEKTVVRLGEFHQVMSFLGVVGKRFKDAGLETLLIESGLVAAGSINGVISGHHYNRSIRSHKVMCEAFARLRFQAFIDSLPDDESDKVERLVHHLVDDFTDQFATVNMFRTTSKSAEIDKLLDQFATFIESQCKTDPTFQFWNSYIEMVELAQDLIRATRTSDWEKHLRCTRNSIPWYFAYDHFNYARYLPAYYLEMKDLPKTHPRIHKRFLEGKWTVKRQTRYAFSATACDQALEQTLNRSSKTSGGVKTFSLNRNAVRRWILASPDRAKISLKCEEMAGLHEESRNRKDLDSTVVRRNEEAVLEAIETITQYIDPFTSGRSELVNICTGVVATAEATEQLQKAYELGEAATQKFMADRLFSKTLPFDAKMTKMKLATFSSKPSKRATKKTPTVDARKIFSRLLLCAGKRDIDLREILSFSLGPVSFPLASADGSLASTPKAKLRQTILERWPGSEVEEIPKDGAIIIDGMAIVQAMKPGSLPDTFGELANQVLGIILSKGREQQRIDVVFDTYPQISIKHFTHETRKTTAGAELRQIMSVDQKLPKQWRNFLSNGNNKTNLINFLVDQWQTVSADILNGKVFYASHDKSCHKIQVIDGNVVASVENDLSCDHEEADTRLLLHAKHASNVFQSVAIYCSDTDVFVMNLAHASEINADFHQIIPNATKRERVLINIHDLAEKMGGDVCSALIGFHCFTGCDSVSCFNYKGKIQPFRIMLENPKFLKVMKKVGENFEIAPTLLTTIEEFVCKIYGQSNVKSVNEARYKLFITKSFGERKLAPTQDALKLHLSRANYQAAILKRALTSQIAAPSPSLHGWVSSDTSIDIKWMEKPEAPEQLVKQTKCGCQKGKCEKKNCSCVANNYSCTDLCSCVNCQNIESTEAELDLENDVSDDDCSDDEY